MSRRVLLIILLAVLFAAGALYVSTAMVSAPESGDVLAIQLGMPTEEDRERAKEIADEPREEDTADRPR